MIHVMRLLPSSLHRTCTLGLAKLSNWSTDFDSTIFFTVNVLVEVIDDLNRVDYMYMLHVVPMLLWYPDAHADPDSETPEHSACMRALRIRI